MRKIIFSYLFILITLSFISSADIEVKIYTNKNKISENEIVKLSIEASNANNFDFAENPSFDPSIVTIKTEQSMNMMIVNGKYTSSYTLTMYLRPTKSGNYTIGPFNLKIKNNIYTTNQVELIVEKSDSSTKKYSYDEDNYYYNNNIINKKSDEKVMNLDYIIELDIPKKEVFVDEGIDISVNLYVRNQLQTIDYNGLKIPSNAWIENIENKNNYAGRVLLNGLYYEHYIIERKKVFISKDGTYKIPPVVYNFYGFSGSSFFFFTEPMTIQTEEANIIVKPLPSNPPQNFNGAIGDFKLTCLLQPDRVKDKESATLTILLEGEGNFHSIREIKYQINEYIEKYSSTQDLKNANNKYKIKKWETLLVPLKPGKHKIKIEEFSFFNPKSSSYITIKGKELTLTVEKNENEEEKDEKLIIFNNNSEHSYKNREIIASDIGYIKRSIPQKTILYNYSLWTIVILSLYLVLILYVGIIVLFKYSIFNRLKNIESFKKRYAYKEFLKDINNIEKKSGNEKIDDLVDKIYKSVEKYFVWKYNIKSVEFTSKGISDSLSQYLEREKINKLKDYILHIDMIRFGGLNSSKQEFTKLIEEVKAIIKSIEG